jgi:hypothetical protein
MLRGFVVDFLGMYGVKPLCKGRIMHIVVVDDCLKVHGFVGRSVSRSGDLGRFWVSWLNRF